MSKLPDSPKESQSLLHVSLKDHMEDERWLEADTETVENQRKKRRGYPFTLTGLIVQLLLIATYTLIFFALWERHGLITNLRKGKTGDGAYSPALEAIHWEPKLFENEIEKASLFKGPPRPELDEAWNKLLAPTAIRVNKRVLDKINRTSVPLEDGSGYMVSLDVYHQLHCLRYVKRYLHRDYYNMTEKNLGQHIDHCLDSLRQYVMCNADVVLQTFDWLPNFHRPWPNFRIVHECANWDAIQDWATEHSFDGFDEKLLKHPNFHPELRK
ncbi:hypothetical protein CRV24_006143 [Beauveria bassiana]|nr:hypothetical protein CRV24_006143 [Beauveria bassiana]